MEYSIRQLVEIATRALSPGINDPFTTINCIDWQGAGISAAAAKELPSAFRHDAEGKCRVVAWVTIFAGLIDACFNQIRQYGGASGAVSARLLEVMALIGSELRTDEQRRVLAAHVEMVYRQASSAIVEQADMAEIRKRYDAAAKALKCSSGR